MWARLLVSIAIASASVSGCSRDPQVAAREAVRSGDKFVAEKRYQEAALSYRSALKYDPRHAEARLKLADTYTLLGDGINALRETIRAADLLPDDAETQLKAGAVLLAAAQFEDARSRADKVLTQNSSNVSALILRANALAGLNQLDDALRDAEEAVRADSDRGTPYSLLGSMHLLRGEKKEAEEAFLKALEVDPRSIEVRLALARFYWAAGRPQDAEPQLKAAVNIDDKDVAANRALAALYLHSGRTPEAEPYLEKVAEVAPGGQGKLSLARYYQAMGRAQEAETILRDVSQPGSLVFVAAKVALADLARSKGEYDNALTLVQEALAVAPQTLDGLVVKNSILLRQRKLAEALTVANAAVESSPKSALAHFALGQTERARGNLDAAIAAFKAAVAYNARLGLADLELAELLLARGQIGEADRFARSAWTKMPGAAAVKLMLARIELAKGDTAAASPLLKELDKQYPTLASVQREVGRLEWTRDAAAARAALERAFKSSPSDLVTLRLLTVLDLKEGHVESAKSRLEQAYKTAPGNAAILILGAQTHAALNDSQKTEELLHRAIAADANQPEAYQMLASLYLSERRPADAISQLTALTVSTPRSATPHTLLGQIYLSQGRHEDAKSEYRKALEKDSAAAVAANNLAWLYAEAGERMDEALQLAQMAKARSPESASVADTLGWVYLKKGLNAFAVEEFKSAVAIQPTNATYHYHLGMAYIKGADTRLGRQALQTALKLGPDAAQAAEARAMLATLPNTGS